MKDKSPFLSGVIVLMALATLSTAARAGPQVRAERTDRPTGIIKDHDRIVFVGDSITGQGVIRGKGGWIALIGEGLRLERPALEPTLTGLGGSGATVGAWLNFEQRSRAAPVILDVKDVQVGKTLDAGADVVIVMLGMNDVLPPV